MERKKKRGLKHGDTHEEGGHTEKGKEKREEEKEGMTTDTNQSNNDQARGSKEGEKTPAACSLF